MAKRLSSIGRYPEHVFRAFKVRSQAEEFIELGRFRMTQLSCYRGIEDENRRDATEGEGHFQAYGMRTTVDFARNSDNSTVLTQPGYVHSYVELLAPTFILCCSLPDVNINYLKERFGSWVVKIKQPKRFAEDICDYLETLPIIGGVEGCSVRYDKGERSTDELNVESIPLSYSQKPAEFSHEKEFRFVTYMSSKQTEWLAREYLPVDLARRLVYTELLS